jgi:hypothetical protein
LKAIELYLAFIVERRRGWKIRRGQKNCVLCKERQDEVQKKEIKY